MEVDGCGVMNDDQKALLITLALAALETVRQAEIPKSKRFYKMDKAISHLVYLTNTYRVVAWPAANVIRAERILDEINERIRVEFGGGGVSGDKQREVCA